jgi:alkylation response protein AidB-like acyl-CoA dehydrogenase
VPLSASRCRDFGEDNALTRENRAIWKIYTIFEGTSEIQRLVIARAISGIHID